MAELQLTKERKTLLHLAAISISDRPSDIALPLSSLQDVDWKAVAKESAAQTLELPCLDAATAYKAVMPETLYARWQGAASRRLQYNYNLTQAQNELCALLEEKGVKYVIIKGTASAAYYPKPELRMLGDIDFLIEKEKKDEVLALLCENGYVRAENWHMYHVNLSKGDTAFEMHFDLPGMPTGELGDKLHAFLEPIFDMSVVYKTEEGAFRAPNDLYHGVVLVLHMLSHNVGWGMGLRHLCDWAAFVAKTENAPFWDTQLLPLLKDVGLYVYASAITKTCAKFLGVTCPDWAAEADGQVCDELLADMFAAGNFGTKDRTYSDAGALLGRHDEKKRGRVRTIAYLLHVSILDRYPIVKKVWILYPFLFVWKVLKNLWYMLLGKRTNIMKTMPQAKKRRKIYDKLKIFERQK